MGLRPLIIPKLSLRLIRASEPQSESLYRPAVRISTGDPEVAVYVYLLGNAHSHLASELRQYQPKGPVSYYGENRSLHRKPVPALCPAAAWLAAWAEQPRLPSMPIAQAIPRLILASRPQAIGMR